MGHEVRRKRYINDFTVKASHQYVFSMWMIPHCAHTSSTELSYRGAKRATECYVVALRVEQGQMGRGTAPS